MPSNIAATSSAAKSKSLEFPEFKKFYAKCLATEEVREKYAEGIAKAAREEKMFPPSRRRRGRGRRRAGRHRAC